MTQMIQNLKPMGSYRCHGWLTTDWQRILSRHFCPALLTLVHPIRMEKRRLNGNTFFLWSIPVKYTCIRCWECWIIFFMDERRGYERTMLLVVMGFVIFFYWCGNWKYVMFYLFPIIFFFTGITLTVLVWLKQLLLFLGWYNHGDINEPMSTASYCDN